VLSFDRFSQLIRRQRPIQAVVDGARLSRCGPGTWVADRELVYSGGNRLPIRMVVFEDTPGEISLYSPVRLDEGTLEALAGLGEVRRVIVPNRFHTLFVAGAMDAFPEARLLVPETDAGLGERFPRRVQRITAVTSLGEQVEIKPVRLRSGLEELVIYNDASELLTVSDLLFNLHQASGMQRWFYVLNGVWQRPALSRVQRLMIIRDLSSVADFYRWAMSKPFSQISMSHGLLIGDQARETFYQLFHRYGTNG